MEAGRRDKLVIIQQRSSVDPMDDAGYPVDGPWTELGREWMSKLSVAELGQQERFVAAQVTASFETEWEMPYRSTMDPEEIDIPKLRRLSYRGRIYDIVFAAVAEVREGKAIKIRTLAASGVPA